MKERGFTLVEVLIATVIITLAIVALLAANSAFTMANGAGIELSTAEFLVEQIKEMTATLEVIDPEAGAAMFGSEEGSLADYDDLDDFDGRIFSPPVDALRQQLTDFAAYSQQVTVQNVNPSNFEQVIADHGSDFVRVTVSVSYNGRELCSISWIRARI